MPFIDITEDVVHDLGVTTFASPSMVPLPEAIRWDCAIGDLPFLYGMSDQSPMRRETSDFRRQRIDSERNPGEQSLDSGYWIRSQSSWHYGSGITSAEPLEINENEARFRYQRGGGVDVWTAGQVTLLHDTEQVFSSSGTGQLLLGVDTGVLHADGTALSYVAASGGSVAVSWGGSSPIQSLTSDGANYYVGTAAGIWKGSLPAGAGSKVWNTSDRTLVRWVKSRLMATVGKAIYELTGTGPALPTALDPGTSRPTGWVWTDISESPQSIYLSGYVGDTSTLESIGVTASSTTVTLSQPTVVADMPRGERIDSIYPVVGRYLVLGTSKGVRVGAVTYSASSYDSVQIGPLVLETADGSSDAVASGPFVYVTVGSKGEAGNHDSRPGLYRIDLGTNLNQSPLDFAHAADLVAPSGVSGSCTQVTIAGGKLFFAVDGAGVFAELDTFVAEGWMETGRIRLGTVENKAWQDMRVLGQPDMQGTVTGYANLYGVDPPSSWAEVIAATGTDPDRVGKMTAAITGPQPNIYVAFRLATTNPSVSPVFLGYQIRAIPAPRRTELVQLMLLNYDFTLDRTGARYGNKNLSAAVFAAIKEMEAASATVTWKDYTTGEQHEVYIERVSFTRTTPPTRNQSGQGGMLSVTLRLV